MKELEEKIITDGKVLKGEVLKVGSFLNQQIDTKLLKNMGEEIKRLFSSCGVTKILTIEASGIAIAAAAGIEMQVPMVFIKKEKTANVSGDCYMARIHSYTHGNDYNACVPKEYLSKEDTVLLVDDFLASGEALHGMINIVNQAGASLAGAVCAVEKGFQTGGEELRSQGIRVEALALIDSMSEDGITFRK